jgi:ATP-binding cassette, subfamily B, bacterial
MKAAEYRRLLSEYLIPLRGQLLLLAALLAGGIALQLVSPQIIRRYLDAIEAGAGQSLLLLAGGLYLALSLAQHGISLAGNYAGQQVAWQATNRMRRDLTLHCLRLDMPFHKTHTPGELIERIDGDVTRLANLLSEFVVRVAANGLLVLGILALLFVESLWVGLLLTGYIALTLVVMSLMQGPASRRWAAAWQTAAEMYGFVEERIHGAEDIRALGAMPYTIWRFLRYLRDWLHTYRRAAMLRMLTHNFTNLLSVIGYALGLAIAVHLYQRGTATIGTAYMVVAYTGMLGVPLQTIRREASDLQQSAASLGRIRALFDLQPQVADVASARLAGQALPSGALEVRFEGVTFGYDNGDAVLRDISFGLAPGRVLGVLGRTGSGKTTLTRLLTRLYDPLEGRVRLSGRELRDVPLGELRQRVGMVTQDVQLFRASVRDNLAFFDDSVSDADIRRALQSLHLWHWASALPHGLDTLLGTGGGGLSAGEAQLLAFARVFLRNPGLVILDEASSRLDPATEALMERAVSRLLAGRTALIIAHRLRTVERADDILILDGGRVLEFGERQALAADPGSRFNRLLQAGLEETLE